MGHYPKGKKPKSNKSKISRSKKSRKSNSLSIQGSSAVLGGSIFCVILFLFHVFCSLICIFPKVSGTKSSITANWASNDLVLSWSFR